MAEIFKGTNADLPEIRKVWKMCFQSPKEICASPYFLQNILKPENTWLLKEDKKIVAIAYRTPHAMMFNGRVLQTSMIVGVATLVQYQKKGYMQELMNTIIDACEHSELITLIQTQDPSLYEPFGFQTVYYRTDYTITRQDVKRITNFGCAYEPSPIDLLKVYSAYIRRFNGFYARDLDYYVQLKKEINAKGGKIVAYYNGKNKIQGYATLIPEGRELKVEECIYLDSLSLVKLINAALQERSTIHLHVSQAENLSLLVPNAKGQEYGFTMARLNDAALFSRLFGVKINTVEEAFAVGNKPLNCNEFM